MSSLGNKMRNHPGDYPSKKKDVSGTGTTKVSKMADKTWNVKPLRSGKAKK